MKIEWKNDIGNVGWVYECVVNEFVFERADWDCDNKRDSNSCCNWWWIECFLNWEKYCFVNDYSVFCVNVWFIREIVGKFHCTGLDEEIRLI